MERRKFLKMRGDFNTSIWKIGWGKVPECVNAEAKRQMGKLIYGEKSISMKGFDGLHEWYK